MYQRILLATDGSESALRAAHKAAHLAKIEACARVTIAYVVDPAASKHDVLTEGSSMSLLEQKRHERVKPVEGLFDRKEVSYDFKLLKGDPGTELTRVANEEEYDVVIMGSRGLNALQEVVLGSVSHKVTLGAQCPVMIVK